MSATDGYCEFCDLPLSQCVHGQPPAPPAPSPTMARAPRTRAVAPARSRVASDPPAKPVARRWTPPEVFKPHILQVLQQAGGELEVEELFLELEIALEDQLRPGDRETTPEGELRWQYAARRARIALVEEGLMIKGRPGMWQLAR